MKTRNAFLFGLLAFCLAGLVPQEAVGQKKSSGLLSINSSPWATVFVDGEKVGVTW